LYSLCKILQDFNWYHSYRKMYKNPHPDKNQQYKKNASCARILVFFCEIFCLLKIKTLSGFVLSERKLINKFWDFLHKKPQWTYSHTFYLFEKFSHIFLSFKIRVETTSTGKKNTKLFYELNCERWSDANSLRLVITSWNSSCSYIPKKWR
jgi:hypothetical protein